MSEDKKMRFAVEEAAISGFIQAPERSVESTMFIMTKEQWIGSGGTEEGWIWMQENGYASQIDWGDEDE